MTVRVLPIALVAAIGVSTIYGFFNPAPKAAAKQIVYLEDYDKAFEFLQCVRSYAADVRRRTPQFAVSDVDYYVKTAVESCSANIVPATALKERANKDARDRLLHD